MSRSILTTLIQDFKTFNGTGNLNRANDKLAEILTMLVDHIHPETAASTVGMVTDAVKTLTTDKAAVAEVKTEVVDAAKALGTTLAVDAVDAITKAGTNVAAEVTTTLTATTTTVVAPAQAAAPETTAPAAPAAPADEAEKTEAPPTTDEAVTDPTTEGQTVKKGGRPKSKS